MSPAYLVDVERRQLLGNDSKVGQHFAKRSLFKVLQHKILLPRHDTHTTHTRHTAETWPSEGPREDYGYQKVSGLHVAVELDDVGVVQTHEQLCLSLRGSRRGLSLSLPLPEAHTRH